MDINMEFVFEQTRSSVDLKYKGKTPTVDQINKEADFIRGIFKEHYPITAEELRSIKSRLQESIIHSIGYADTLQGRDSEHKTWYFVQENDGFYWNRYKTLLSRKWSSEVVERLHTTTNSIMDNLGDPYSDMPFQRRGLLLGDVQSGKTATYTAICNKAADAGYKIIIVLAGMMENLRIQTQERLDSEFVGLDSKHSLDKKVDNARKNVRVGVGKIPPSNDEKSITRFTSVTLDFKQGILNSLGLNLKNLHGTALFVVKKNKSILNNLQQWLTKDDEILDLPLLLIDDEADNASINTNSEEKKATAINHAINKILRSFKQANYLGITATPFANIFIDPSIAKDGAAKDLFPKDFITVLPVPDNYIGAEKIFGNGYEEGHGRIHGKYESAIVKIDNDEQKYFYVFRHKKELADELISLPSSMYEAIRYFVLVTAVGDLRYDNTEHRSMMINVSRFTVVQNSTTKLVNDYIEQLRSDIENYAQLSMDKVMQISNIQKLKSTWNKYGLAMTADIEWEDLLKNYLFKAIRRIEVRAVNQTYGASSLDYYSYKGVGMRVIAIGGNSLSRGLTLEGLCVTYFYRNTMMYDTLLQMGRWFGYRSNYDDLFKIWLGEDAVDWYGYITDASNELKEELRIMAGQKQTPEEFGLKVRQSPGVLIVTARNKMRSGVEISMPITVSGRMIETPRLRDEISIIKKNNDRCWEFIEKIDKEAAESEYDSNLKTFIWRQVPKSFILELVNEYICHPWNVNFQAAALSDYIKDPDNELEMWDVAIPFGKSEEKISLHLNERDIVMRPEMRRLTRDISLKMLRVNDRHVRVGSGGCSKIGLSQEQITKIRAEAKAKGAKLTDKTYLIENRNPILLLHLMDNTNNELKKYPKLIFALGLGFPGGKEEKTAKYIVNTIEQRNMVDIEEFEDEEDNI